uniref:Transposase n=1 Tax=Steinernema glaseri TaxID=37863 RepID=A0A1I8A6U7_9BILA
MRTSAVFRGLDAIGGQWPIEVCQVAGLISCGAVNRIRMRCHGVIAEVSSRSIQLLVERLHVITECQLPKGGIEGDYDIDTVIPETHRFHLKHLKPETPL